MPQTRETSSHSPFTDHSLYGILLGNLVTLAAALANDWSIGPLLWIYWGQSVVIGIANVVRMLRLREFSTDGFTSGGRRVPETRAGKVQTAMFFAFHYGFFHLVYCIFLASEGLAGKLNGRDLIGVAVSVAAFGFAHAYSLLWNEARDFNDRKPIWARSCSIPTCAFSPRI